MIPNVESASMLEYGSDETATRSVSGNDGLAGRDDGVDECNAEDRNMATEERLEVERARKE